MVRIPDETVNDIRQSTNILDVIGQYVQLNKSGQNYFAHCPFHEDNTPSFSVNEKKQIFKCFSCGRGGNVFSFIQEIDELSFPESVIKVAEFSSVSIDENIKNDVLNGGRPADSRKSKLYAIHEKASDFYQHLLVNAEIGDQPFQYLIDRGLSEETVDEFQIGFSPAKRNSLQLYLNTIEDINVDRELLTSTGIFSENNDDEETELLDRFSNRIIFPIRDFYGNIAGFSGRDFQKNSDSNGYKRAKYLNSPETELFNKRNILFNYRRAKKTIKKEGEVILFEGFMDVISSWQAGIKHGIASMGTSLTDQQIKTIENITDKLVIAFDGDNAGIEATKRIVDLLEESSDLTIEVLSFPEGLDPDDFIHQKGVDSYVEFTKQGRDTFMNFLMKYHRRDINLNNEVQRIEYIDLILNELTKVPSAIEREMYLKQLSDEFNMSFDLLNEQVQTNLVESNQERINELRKNRENNKFSTIKAAVSVVNKPKKTKVESAELMMLNRLFYYEEAWSYLESVDNNFVFVDDAYQQIFILFDNFKQYNINIDDFIDTLDNDLKQIVTDVLWLNLDTEPSFEEIYDYVQVIRKDYPIEQQIKDKRDELEQAQRTGDSKEQLALTIEITNLYRKLKNPKE